MSSEQEPDEGQADRHEPENTEVLTLVDLFDRMDREAFRRALNGRDHYYPPSDRR